jgi:hypothetical protein
VSRSAHSKAARGRSTGSTLALVALAWITLIAPPCVMGLAVDRPAPAAEDHAHHDCPHCPPEAAPEAARDDCSSVSAEHAAAPRADKPAELPALAPSPVIGIPVLTTPARAHGVSQAVPAPPPRPGPRPHLQHGQFNE